MSLRVLVVEEEWVVRDLLQIMLEQEDHQVELAAGGREGVKKADAGSYDLVIIDVGMADLSGEQVARTIRGQGLKLPIIACTGGDMTSCPEWANALLLKPFRINDLRTAIEQALGQSR